MRLNIVPKKLKANFSLEKNKSGQLIAYTFFSYCSFDEGKKIK